MTGKITSKKFFIIILITLHLSLLADNFIKFNEIAFLQKANKSKEVINLSIALAKTPAQQRKGLMKVNKMDEFQGMLFIFHKEDHRIFWMKDTYIPLDLIFLNKNKVIVGIVENNKPMSEKNIKIKKKAQYILELNAGFVKKYGVELGDKLIQ